VIPGNEFTLTTLLQGAWAVLLSRYNDEPDVVFGVVRACRSAIAGADAIKRLS
jgi:non-ribosomal peptide synthetase component F